ncbi:oxidoreductase [Trichoderma chlorosporum]
MSSHSKQSAPDKPHEGSSGDNEILEGLKTILKNQSHLFACGGKVPIRDKEQSQSGNTTVAPFVPSESRLSNPITIRWDTHIKSQAESCAKVELPSPIGAVANLNQLLQDCQPATFGLGGQDTYDKSYREALQMAPDAFCTDFDPYSLGIIDTVAQVLLPSVLDSPTHRSVRAELYKLNIYSGPSGKFKPHVDTPRSSMQFGSLVVCLPVEHEGGQLKVRHKGEQMTFDWSTNQDRPSCAGIHWAAFYSDCEHEVLEVTNGHRLTLTYNLYAARGVGRLTGVSPALNPAHLPLFDAINGMLHQDPFNGQGGTLGFWCSHAYAYNVEAETPLPATLKGVDAVLWETFQALGMDPKVAPVIQMKASIHKKLKNIYKSPNPSKYIMYLRESMPSISEMPSKWIVGHKFGGVYIHDADRVEAVEEYHELYQSWGDYSRERIHWLTQPGQSELQVMYMAYGNEANTGTMYSNCAILVTIPKKE